MQEHKWEKTWKDKKFSISTFLPSVLVSRYENLLKDGDEILDIGCGNGRNSIYLASKGFKVHCFDVADIGWYEKLPTNVSRNINFKKINILDYAYKDSHYRLLIVARVIQYLDPTELSFLINKIRTTLKPNGFLLLSYSAAGGIFDQKDIDVPKYLYTIKQVVAMLKNIFRNVVVTEGSKKNVHVNYNSDVQSFDIFASEPLAVNNSN